MKADGLSRDQCCPIDLRVQVLACLIAGALMSTTAADDSEQGKPEYLRNCASCHGINGRGAGPASIKLKRKAADLTTLARRNGGVYSPPTVYEMIDGRKAIRAHRPGDMPVWGCRHTPPPKARTRAVKSTELESLLDLACDPETVIRARIESIVQYLQTIQAK